MFHYGAIRTAESGGITSDETRSKVMMKNVPDPSEKAYTVLNYLREWLFEVQ